MGRSNPHRFLSRSAKNNINIESWNAMFNRQIKQKRLGLDRRPDDKLAQEAVPNAGWEAHITYFEHLTSRV